MFNLTKKKFLDTNFFYVINIGFFSFFINFYYSNLGVFPIDTFLHYDSAYRILNNEYPIKDFWIVSGLVVDIIQSLFFSIFGINWFSYIIHGSFFNLVIAIFVYLFFLNLGLDKLKAFIISICFATLSYSISGTPFVDLHATFFLLIATLLIIKNLNTQKGYEWSLIIFLLFLSFFSKQVPAAYATIIYSPILLIYFISKKNLASPLIIIFTTLILIFILSILLNIYDIEVKNFYIQYLDYPRSIGGSRFSNIDLSGTFNKFKFIIFPLTLLTILKLKKIILQKEKFFSEKSFGFFIFLILSIILIFHQAMTKNQIYIYFLIPLLFGFIENEISRSKLKFKKYISLIAIFVLVLITIKYHLRFNENRKFHELTKINLNNTLEASEIHKSLKGLKWKNPFYENPSQEILILNQAIKKLNNFNQEIMVITNYLFLDSITSKKLNYPNRTFTIDGTIVPAKDNLHYENYKNFLLKKIKKEKISNIIFFKHEKISKELILDYISERCLEVNNNDEILYIFKIKCLY